MAFQSTQESYKAPNRASWESLFESFVEPFQGLLRAKARFFFQSPFRGFFRACLRGFFKGLFKGLFEGLLRAFGGPFGFMEMH